MTSGVTDQLRTSVGSLSICASQWGHFLFEKFPLLALPFVPLFPVISLLNTPFVSFGLFIFLFSFVTRNPEFSRFVRFNTLQVFSFAFSRFCASNREIVISFSGFAGNLLGHRSHFPPADNEPESARRPRAARAVRDRFEYCLLWDNVCHRVLDVVQPRRKTTQSSAPNFGKRRIADALLTAHCQAFGPNSCHFSCKVSMVICATRKYKKIGDFDAPGLSTSKRGEESPDSLNFMRQLSELRLAKAKAPRAGVAVERGQLDV